MTEFTLPQMPFDVGLPDEAPVFADPEPLVFEADEVENIEKTIKELYKSTVEARQKWNKQHQDFDLMFRGQLDSGRSGPWPDSSDLHVQMPYWLVDAYNTRLVSGVFEQTPAVAAIPEEDADIEIAANAANLVDWHMQPKRMNARANWSRISKTRCIHGRGVGVIPWVKDEYKYRVKSDEGIELQRDAEGNPMVDENFELIEAVSRKVATKTASRMNGPLLVPVEWDDVIEPLEGINLQPVSPSNPLGAEFVGIRQWESLNLIWKKRENSYTYIDQDDELSDRDAWLDKKPSQDRSGSGAGTENQQRVKLQDYVTGKERNQARTRTGRTADNPEFETLLWMMPWEIENEDGDMEQMEVVFFYCVSMDMLMGAFLLSDLQWRNKRPLLELDFQKIGTRRDSMGIMEIVQHLSAELDTIHNMRMDVGFATNMPFFFYRSTSGINPERIVLRPGKGVPIDDIRDVSFPQMQNVTSFYHQEETLLYSLVERVLGVTDLFLGVSPTRGAAARHATGFVGTQQEALARTSEVINQDAIAFSHLCHMIYELEVQFGPPERIMRLQGKEGPMTQELTRQELWMRGEYDFRIGSNHGLYSSQMKQEQAQGLAAFAQTSPLINGDPGRRWEFERTVLESMGFDNPQMYIGPKEAVSQGVPKNSSEENGEMDQHLYGVGVPSPVHADDNDAKHIQDHMRHMESEGYISAGKPNFKGHVAHAQAQMAQMQQKQQAQQAQALAAAQGQTQQQEQPSPGMNGSQPTASNVASLQGVEQQGQMGALPAGENGSAPPNF